MSGTWRMHLDAVTARFPHEGLHGAASEEVFATRRQLQSRRLCSGLIKASAAAPSVQNSVSVTSTSSKGETHVHLNKSVNITPLAPQLAHACMGQRWLQPAKRDVRRLQRFTAASLQKLSAVTVLRHRKRAHFLYKYPLCHHLLSSTFFFFFRLCATAKPATKTSLRASERSSMLLCSHACPMLMKTLWTSGLRNEAFSQACPCSPISTLQKAGYGIFAA